MKRIEGPRLVLAASLLLALGLAAGAQDATLAAATKDAASTEDDMFGAPETVTQAAATSTEAEGKSDFLKYDQVKVGGSLTGSVGFSSIWADAWGGSSKLLDPDSYYLTPAVAGKVTLVAKPSTDFGVNMDFRTSWPFQSTESFLTSAVGNATSVTTKSGSVSVPNISVWSLYSKFNWHDKVYFSFGKQPLSWGVSKGAFQPADDIFALSPAIDLADTGAEREGPVSLKTTIPMSVTNNLYFFAGLPADSSGGSKVDPADVRLAAKGEFSFGNTELALGAFYAYNDHPRAMAMATTGIGQWNLFGEGVLKYGSERYFLSKNGLGMVVGAQESGKLYFTGTAGGYYTNSDSNLTISMAYMYNGEGQPDVNAAEAFVYYAMHSDQIDRMKFGTHYAFASISKGDVLPSILGKDKLSASLIAIADLSDFSGYLMPSLTWSFFDYASLKAGGTFSLGKAGGEYITYGVGGGLGGLSLPDKPGAALNLTLTIGTGSF